MLAIDAGNTRIKWGVHGDGRWLASGAILTAESAGWGAAWQAAPKPDRAIASNVAGSQVLADLERACKQAGVPLQVIRPVASLLGVTNGYADPGQLGSDRWASLIAAHHLSRGHKLVVNVGTALTIDALTAEGQFLGGVIVPGPALMRRSLDRGTAGLRLTEGEFNDLPRSTPDAITSGAIAAGVGAITRLADAMAKQGVAPANIILSGGASGEISPHLPIPFAIHENLVLDGLVLIARNC
ncbi:MAG TPA: type III pantothenate kinase [Usitatibacter sp.]|nr:type III pantothenate kinase [Usitatibacter sp.]